MKKSKFIKQVLKSKDNTVFVNEEQVANAIEVFEKLGMLPPYTMDDSVGELNDWDKE